MWLVLEDYSLQKDSQNSKVKRKINRINKMDKSKKLLQKSCRKNQKDIFLLQKFYLQAIFYFINSIVKRSKSSSLIWVWINSIKLFLSAGKTLFLSRKTIMNNCIMLNKKIKRWKNRAWFKESSDEMIWIICNDL
jgi:hypothetical protein